MNYSKLRRVFSIEKGILETPITSIHTGHSFRPHNISYWNNITRHIVSIIYVLFVTFEYFFFCY